MFAFDLSYMVFEANVAASLSAALVQGKGVGGPVGGIDLGQTGVSLHLPEGPKILSGLKGEQQ